MFNVLLLLLTVVDADYQVAIARLYEPIILEGMLEVCPVFSSSFNYLMTSPHFMAALLEIRKELHLVFVI
jgi:hypothetical protein